MKRVWATIVLLWAVVAVAQQAAPINLNSASGPLYINGEHYNYKANSDGSYSFDGTGNPVTFERPEKGMILSSNHATLHFFKPEEGGDFVLQDGTFIGMAHLHDDTSAADKFLLSEKKPVPVRASQSQIDLTSERFDYAGSVDEGTITLPQPLTLVDNSKGTRTVKRKVKGVELTGPENFDQAFRLEGSSGKIVLNPSSAVSDKSRLKKGTVAGPVTFHLIRTSKGPGDLQVVTEKTDGTADNVSFNFTGAFPTITAQGHVVIVGSNGALDGTFNSDMTVITLDQTLKITGVESTGNPTTSQLRRLGGGQ